MTLEELVYSFCEPVYIIATQVSTNLYTKALKIDVWASEYDFEIVDTNVLTILRAMYMNLGQPP